MLLEKMINRLPIRSQFVQLLIGSVSVALVISLGMIYVLMLFHVALNPAVPSSIGAVGAAIYAARVKAGA